ncbi:hypothetical protein KCTC32516_01097 [Polaribacter huanghezhanensis]|uniref:vitamin K epoxide reductase family protein n=1 Tax=Polaribacter huanghezhanensis TaxID=1354726 RepID=UPI0026474C32|nr:vitamin K epoxide reductase family protein [Polaribacter huanghezhanensis]WKD85751.1 hypothetical protein KCTC32516_01097 [Polaribacter huanghezhanensis]
MEKELKQIIESFLGFNKIIFNKEELHLQLLTHPYFPSINAITDLFDHFKIENIAAELPQEISIIAELPDTFLAHIKEENIKKIVLVVKKNNDLKLIYSAKTTKNLSHKEFVGLWTGVVVAIEKNENVVRNNSNSKSILKPLALGVFVLVVAGVLIIKTLSVVGYGYLSISIIGFYISILLVQKELGLHSKSLDRFCEASENNSCDDVLNSKGATIFGVFKLSDVGLVYFSSIILSIFLFSLTKSETSNQFFYNLSVLSLLFIPYSIYYQWRVIKKWCPLCLIVLGVLFIQGLIVLFFANISFAFNSTEIIVSLFSFLALSIFWTELKTGFKKKQEFNVLQLEHYKFKRNSSLFITALKSSDKKEMTIAGIHEIVLGNKNAKLKIVLVTNPTCFFCKEAHQIFHEILKNRKEDIQLMIRFNVNTSNPETNVGLEISNQLLEIYANQNEEKTLEVLDEIYSDTEPEVWLQKWKSTTFLNYVSELEKAKEWCTNNAVNFTPAVFINGYLFPKEYNKKDISFFIDDIIEEEI